MSIGAQTVKNSAKSEFFDFKVFWGPPRVQEKQKNVSQGDPWGPMGPRGPVGSWGSWGPWRLRRTHGGHGGTK